MVQERHNNSINSFPDPRISIASLEGSTRALETHIAATQTARKYVSNTKDNVNPSPKRPGYSAPQTQHLQQSRLISSLQQTISDNQRTSNENLQKAISHISITIEDTLSRQDHQINQLEQRLSRCGDPSAEDAKEEENEEKATINTERVEKLLTALQHTQAEIIRTRLNRIYLAALHSHTNAENGISTAKSKYNNDRPEHVSSQINSTRSDLSTLHSEIPTLSSMLTSHLHGDPLHEVMSALSTARSVLSAQQTSRAVDQLNATTRELEMLAERAEGLQSQRILQRRLKEYLDEAMQTGATTAYAAGQSTVQSSRTQLAARDDTALKALQGYLGLSASTTSTSTSTNAARTAQAGSPVKGEQGERMGGQQAQIDDAFEEFTNHVQAAMAHRQKQREYLRPHASLTSGAGQTGAGSGLDQDQGQDEHSAAAPSPQMQLHDLDQMMAKIKRRLDEVAT